LVILLEGSYCGLTVQMRTLLNGHTFSYEETERQRDLAWCNACGGTDRKNKAPFLPPRRCRWTAGVRTATVCRAPMRHCWAPGAGAAPNAF